MNTGKRLATLRGHVSNVFSALFFNQNREEVISGGNDADIRHFNIERNMSLIYRHHLQKVLQLSINPMNDFTFLSCSADGTARFFDTRVHYQARLHRMIFNHVMRQLMFYRRFLAVVDAVKPMIRMILPI